MSFSNFTDGPKNIHTFIENKFLAILRALLVVYIRRDRSCVLYVFEIIIQSENVGDSSLGVFSPDFTLESQT